MNKSLLMLFFALSIALTSAKGQEASICEIINDLNCHDPVVVDNISKRLGLMRGALGLSKVQVVYPYRSGPSSPVFIIAISWEGPRDGYVVLVDSKGDVLAKQRVGYIKSLTIRPLRSDGDDNIVIDAITGTGTGIREDQFFILSIKNLDLNESWVALSYKKSFPGQLYPGSNYEIKGSLRFDDLNGDGKQEIIYSKKRKEYFYDAKLNKLILFKTQKSTEVYELKQGRYLKRIE